MSYETVRKAAGYRFRIRSNVPSAPFVLDRLLAAFPKAPVAPRLPTYTLVERGRDGRRFALDLDGSPIQRVARAGSMIDWLVADITLKAVERTEGFVAVHAGAASWNRRAILLPAAPDSGKTTTVAGLTRAGFSYLSDEVALLHLQTSRVHPFPRPLMMEPGSVEVLDGLQTELPEEYEDLRLRIHHIAPNDLRPRAVGGLCRVAFVIAPQYRKGAGTRLVPMTKAETLFVLAENSFNLESVGSAGLAALTRVAATTAGYRLEIGDLASAVNAVKQLVCRSDSVTPRSR